MQVSGRFLAEPVSINDPLRSALSRDPEALALHDLNRSMSWAELEQSCHALANHYLSIGLRTGDRIASLMPNSLELLIHYLAGLRCGLVLTPLNYRYTVPEINHALEVSGARCLIHHCERQEDVEASNVSSACDFGCITTNEGGFVSELSVGEEGVLWVKSPTLTVGYWNNPAATAEIIVRCEVFCSARWHHCSLLLQSSVIY